MEPGDVVARSYRELLVWQKAKALAIQTYKGTANFPKAETYGLTSQIRRAVVSVASNIAEGQGRLTCGEFRHFLGQSKRLIAGSGNTTGDCPGTGVYRTRRL